MSDINVGDRVVSWPEARVFGTVTLIIERPPSCFSTVVVEDDSGEEHRGPAWSWWLESEVPNDILTRKNRKPTSKKNTGKQPSE